MFRILNNYFTRRATNADLGKKVAVIWNPQGVQDFKEKPNWWNGVIEHVGEDDSFWISLIDGGTMVCPAMIFGWRKNPFSKNIKLL